MFLKNLRLKNESVQNEIIQLVFDYVNKCIFFLILPVSFTHQYNDELVSNLISKNNTHLLRHNRAFVHEILFIFHYSLITDFTKSKKENYEKS
jgi:hypothetical protein